MNDKFLLTDFDFSEIWSTQSVGFIKITNKKIILDF